MTREQIEREVLAWIAEGVDAPADDARFESLALALYAVQYEQGDAFRRFCNAVGRTPDRVKRWQEIPAVPTGAFKEARLAAFPEAATVRVFQTSGSTTELRGRLELDNLTLYEASLLETFRSYICPDVERIRFLVLAPSANDAPDSSLSYMFAHAARKLGDGPARFYLDPSGWDVDALLTDLEALTVPVLLAGTSFAFVHLLDAFEARGLDLKLPEGTRVMETGGFKGRSRELTRDELHGGIERRLGVPRARIVNQYGMCELGSQFYEPSLRCGQPTTTKCIPPWVRTRVVDPSTLMQRPPGETGILEHVDLANTGSVLAVQTSDRGRLVDDRLEILGRVTGAEARGCSIAADAILERR